MKKIILAGGGHAHLEVIRQADEFIKRGHSVTLISPSPYHYYSGMGPGMLAGDYALEEIGFDIKGMIESAGGIFVQDKVVEVKAKSRELILQSGAKVGYDVVSFNIGSIVSSEINLSGKEDVFTVKPIYNLYRARQRIMNWPEGSPLRIAVIGGGPAAVEVVGCAWTLTNSRGLNASLEIVAGERLLKRFPERVRSIVFKSFRERGIKVIEGVRAKKVEDDKIVLENGDTIKADIIFLSTGVKPPELFIKSGLPVGPDGGLLVNEYLQSVAHPELFGGGDCIYFKPNPLEKVGVYAVRENPVLFHNLLAATEGGPLMKFNPGGSYLLVFNLGGRKGVFWKNSLIFNGKIAFFIKDYIDRRFIRRFKI